MGKVIKVNLDFTNSNIGHVSFQGSVVVSYPITELALSVRPSTITDLLQLSVSKTPSNTTDTGVVWSSSNTAIAIVNSNGLVTVISNGTVTITVTSTANNAISDSFTAICTKTVSVNVIPVDSVSILGGGSAVSVGATIQLSANVLPLDASDTGVVWSSSNAAIATVNSSGLVTTISAGTVVITCISATYTSKSATISVTVNAVSATVKKILLKQSVTVNGSSAWWWTDPKTGYIINKTYLHTSTPTTVQDVTGAVIAGLSKMTLAQMTAINANITANAGLADMTLTGKTDADCAYSLTTVKNIGKPNGAVSSLVPSAQGFYCPNGTYHFKALIGCPTTRSSADHTLKINGTLMSVPVFECMDNLSHYIEGDFIVTTGYILFELGKSASYLGTTPAGFSLLEVDMTVMS